MVENLFFIEGRQVYGSSQECINSHHKNGRPGMVFKLEFEGGKTSIQLTKGFFIIACTGWIWGKQWYSIKVSVSSVHFS